MTKMLLLFSHELTKEQKEDSKNYLNVSEFIELSKELQDLWKNIPATIPSLNNYLKPFYKWLKENSVQGDFVLIQGDFGAVNLMVNYSFSLGLISVYATTKRIVSEEKLSDNRMKIEHIFKHKIFRKYEKQAKCHE